MNVLAHCPGGRVIEQRAVTAAPGVDDWFHTDDGSHCEHRIEVESLRAQLRGAVETLELLRDGLEGGIDGVGDVPFEARLILQARVREGLRRAERRDE